MREEMRAAIEEILDNGNFYLEKEDNGCYTGQIYADYRDELSNDQVLKIMSSDDPANAFWDMLLEAYQGTEWQYREEIEQKVRKELTAEDGMFPNGMTPVEEEVFADLMMEMVGFLLPEDHFLKQDVCVNIMVDTGDGNYDYVLNSVYPAYCGEYNERIDDRASITWLARSQGYTKTQLWKAMRSEEPIDYNSREPDGFLKSMRKEAVNIASHMNILTFLVSMTLEDLIKLNRLVKLQDRNGHYYDARKNPYCGYIIIEKGTETGLYDPWSGGGSLFEIELEKDVRLPIKYIRSALPDGGDGYSVESVYGMCRSAWRQDAVKKIHGPTKLSA